jgi:FdhE protein
MSSVSGSWDRRIARAEQLAAEGGPSAPLLAFYARLLRHQKAVYDSFDRRRPTGSFEADVNLIAKSGSALLRAVAEHGPDQLAAEADSLLETDQSVREQLLLTYWHGRSDRQFFPKALLQPYGQWLGDAAVGLVGGSSATAQTGPSATAQNRCPRCGGAPQMSMLEAGGGTSVDGNSRHLLCATCLTMWPFRRVVCPSCGEEDERKLGYFLSPVMEHVRVEACESCGRYLKTVDLGRLGVAVPLVDEVAAASLDVWARGQGFRKIELNLVGL